MKPKMEKLWHEFEELQNEFHEVVENYPLLDEDINKIFDKDIKEISLLIDKNDEYYLKKAISKIEDLIDDIKEKSEKTEKIFQEYDKLAERWNNLKVTKMIDEEKLSIINKQVKKANDLINMKNYDDVKKGYDLFSEAVKKLEEYAK